MGGSYSGSAIGKRRLNPWNSKVESKDLTLPKTKFLVRAIMLMQSQGIYNEHILPLYHTAASVYKMGPTVWSMDPHKI